MSTEKRVIAGISVVLAVILLLCTFGAQRQHHEMLPGVMASIVHREEDGGVAFPPEGVFLQGDGTYRVYRLTEEVGSFGIKRYYVKEVLVSAHAQPDGTMRVYGLYALQDPYVFSASSLLRDGTEVICRNG